MSGSSRKRCLNGHSRGAIPLVLLLGAGPAWAEAGDHVHLGQSELIPSVQLATEYQTNPYLEEGTSGDPLDPGASLKIRPGLQINYSTNDIKFNGGFGWGMRQYLTPGLSGLNYYTDFDTLINLTALPEANIGFKLTEDVRNRARAADVGNEEKLAEADVVGATEANLRRFTNETLALVAWHPGGALTADVGGHVLFDRYTFPYDSVPEGQPLASQKVGFGPDVEVQWRFFPKTSLVVDAQLEKFNWTPNVRTSGADGDKVSGKADGLQVQGTLGVRGRVTEKVTVNVMGGYGHITYNEDSVSSNPSAGSLDITAVGQDLKGLDGLIAVGEGSYSPSENHSLTLGVRKEFADSYFTNYLDYLNLYGRYQGKFFDRLGVVGEVAFRMEDYVGTTNREDNFARARLDLAYRTTTFLDLGAGVIYTGRTNTDGTNPGIDYKNTLLVLGATLTY